MVCRTLEPTTSDIFNAYLSSAGLLLVPTRPQEVDEALPPPTLVHEVNLLGSSIMFS